MRNGTVEKESFDGSVGLPLTDAAARLREARATSVVALPLTTETEELRTSLLSVLVRPR